MTCVSTIYKNHSIMDTSYTEDHARFTRLCRLLIDYGTPVLADVFNRQVSTHYPGKLLSDILHLTVVKNNLSKVAQFNKKQRDLLYPHNTKTNLGIASTTLTVKDFDITLLCLLLRNICGLKNAFDKIWQHSPVGLSIEEDIVRLRDARNELYGHITTATVDSKLFEKYWNDITAVFLRLSSVHTQDDFNQIKSEPIEFDLLEQHKQLLDMWHQEVSFTAPILTRVNETLHAVLQEHEQSRKAREETGKQFVELSKQITDMQNEIGNLSKKLVEVTIQQSQQNKGSNLNDLAWEETRKQFVELSKQVTDMQDEIGNLSKKLVEVTIPQSQQNKGSNLNDLDNGQCVVQGDKRPRTSAFVCLKKKKRRNLLIQNQIPQNDPSLAHPAGRRVVTKKQASEIGNILGVSWLLLAYRFSYSSAEVDKLQLTNQFSVSVQSVALLQNWLEREKEKATVDILIRELRQLVDIDHGKIRDIFPEYYMEQCLY